MTTQADELWEIGAAAVRAELKDATWNAWFREVRAVEFDGATLTLSVPSGVTREKLRSNYTGLLTSLLQEATGEDIEVDLVVAAAPRLEEEIRLDDSLSIRFGDDLPTPATVDRKSTRLNSSHRT